MKDFEQVIGDLNSLISSALEKTWSIEVTTADNSSKEKKFDIFFCNNGLRITNLAQLLSKKETFQFLDGIMQGLNLALVSKKVDCGEVVEELSKLNFSVINDFIPYNNSTIRNQELKRRTTEYNVVSPLGQSVVTKVTHVSE